MPRWPSQTRRKFGPRPTPEQLAAAAEAEAARRKATAAAKRARKKAARSTPKPPPKPRVSAKVLAAVDLIADEAVKGKSITITDAAERVGLSREGLSKALRRDEVSSRAAAKVRELVGGAGLIKAGATAVAMLDAQSEYVRAETAFKLLAIAGIKPREQGAAAGGGVTVNLILKHVQRPAEPISGTSAQLIDGTTGQAIEPAR